MSIGSEQSTLIIKLGLVIKMYFFYFLVIGLKIKNMDNFEITNKYDIKYKYLIPKF